MTSTQPALSSLSHNSLSHSDVFAVVRQVVGDILPEVTDIPGHKHLKDLGADSVDRVEIILALMDHFGVQAPMSDFSAVPDVDRLVTFLAERSTR